MSNYRHFALQDEELEIDYHSLTYACHTTSGSPSSTPTYAKFYQFLTSRSDIVDASNTKRLTSHQEAYQHEMDHHGHREVF